MKQKLFIFFLLFLFQQVLVNSHKVNQYPLSYGSKTLWFYGCCWCGENTGANKISVESLIASKINYIPIIPGININDTNQKLWGTHPTDQYDLYNKLVYNETELQQLHDAGITITLSLGGWAKVFPMKTWNDQQVNDFVDQFEVVRKIHNYNIDGLDIDWEAYCPAQDGSLCDTWKVQWQQITQNTVNTLNKIAKEMKRRGFVMTLVPMSTQMYSKNKTALQNQFINYNIDFELFDGIMLQWYTGYAFEICTDIKSCGCHQNQTTCVQKCPRSIDCPDWAYDDQSKYQAQIELLKQLNNRVQNMDKFVIGFSFIEGILGPNPQAQEIYGLDQALNHHGFQFGLGGTGGWTIGGSPQYQLFGQNGLVTNLQSDSYWGNQLHRQDNKLQGNTIVK